MTKSEEKEIYKFNIEFKVLLTQQDSVWLNKKLFDLIDESVKLCCAKLVPDVIQIVSHVDK